MGFSSVGVYANAHVNGAERFSSFRKVPSQASTAGYWYDLTMAAGTPPANFYAAAPLTSTYLDPERVLFAGSPVAPATRHLSKCVVMTPTANAVPCTLMLCDFLLYYPFIDLMEASQQVMFNTQPLPRYASGDGVMAMMVAQNPPGAGGIFTYGYTNHLGNPKTSAAITLNSNVNISTVMTSGPATGSSPGPWLPMTSGDKGIRTITDLTLSAQSTGGLVALVLVKPLLTLTILDITAPVEITAVERFTLPQIYDGACLGFIGVSMTGSVAAAMFTGWIETVWQ